MTHALIGFAIVFLLAFAGGLSAVSNVPGFEPGRRLIALIPSTTWGYAVALSRSSRVNTVSRCIAARFRGRLATMIRSAAPPANSEVATWLIAC